MDRTARGSAAPLPPSHRGVHRALTVEDDTGTSSQGPRRPRVAFRTPRPVEALRIRLPAQPVPVPPPCTARGSAAPLPPSHRGVNHALTVEDDAARRALPTTYDCGSSTRPTSPGPLKFGSDHPAGKPPLTRRPAHPRACDVTRPPGPRMHSSPTCAGPRWYSGPTVRQSTKHARGSGIPLCPPPFVSRC